MAKAEQFQHIRKMIEFDCIVLGTNYRGVPNIIDFNPEVLTKHEEWTTDTTEIGVDQMNMTDYVGQVAIAYKKDTELAGILLIKHIDLDYYLIPAGTSDFIVKCKEIAKQKNMKILE